VLVGEVEDRLGVLRTRTDAFEIIQVAAPELGTPGLQRGGRGVGPGQPDDLVTRGEQDRFVRAFLDGVDAAPPDAPPI
jgi:hypothetical protein